MIARSVILFTFVLFVVAACANSATPTTIPTPVPPSPTSLPPTLAPTSAPPTVAPTITTSPIDATATVPSAFPLLTPAPAPREIAFAKSYLQVHYCTDGATPLKMTILTPKNLTAPAPVLIHAKIQYEFIRPFVERGYIVADVDWREPPANKLPTGVEDVKCAIRYLRANAQKYNLDPKHIGIFGCSRGGHMAALVGVTDAGANMEGNFGFENESSRVQAVAMFDGIANMKTNYADAPGELNEVHGITSFDDPQVARLSPITYASKEDPPFFILASDSEGWRAEAGQMQAALQAVNVPVTYIPMEGATHCKFPFSGDYAQEKIIDRLTEFFDSNLK